MKSTDEAEFRSEDLAVRLAAWMTSTSPTQEPAGLVARAVRRTESVRQRPAILARPRFGEWILGLPDFSRRAQLVFVVGLLVVSIVAAAAVGGRLLNELTVTGVSNSLLVLVPDSTSGKIRAIRPDGQVVGVVDGNTNGCDRHVLVADGSRVAYTFQGMPLEIVPLDGSDRVTVGTSQFLAGVFSPDRTRYAYLAGPADRADLAIVSLLDGTTTVVARDLQVAQFGSLAWSVDGTLAIGFQSETEYGIDLIDADGANWRPLVRRPREELRPRYFALSWSPDGKRLALETDRDPLTPGNARRTWLVDAATGRSTLVATADGRPVDAWMVVANSTVFAWSPDGRQVAYGPGPGRPDLGARDGALLDLDTGASRALPEFGFAPIWSPDGSRIAFLSQDGARLTTMRADLSGRVDQSVQAGATSFAWSPDSRQIAVLTAGSLDLLDATGDEPPTRISNDVQGWGGCMTWSEFEVPATGT